jgi:hypothetical protein
MMEETHRGSLGVDLIGPDVDEGELNAEFQQLELECELEKSVGDNNVNREIGKVSIMEEVKGTRRWRKYSRPRRMNQFHCMDDSRDGWKNRKVKHGQAIVKYINFIDRRINSSSKY